MNRPFELHNAPPITLEIKYGMKKISKRGKPYPTKLNHFLVVTREKGDLNFEIAKDVHERLGSQRPKSIPIRLLSDRTSENFSLFRGMFSNQGILGCGSVYGDSKALRRFQGSGKDFQMCEPFEVDCSSECQYWQSGKCDISGMLYFRLPEDLPRSGALGTVRINGTHAQRRIRASLDIIRKQTGGFLANLPLKIVIWQESKRAADGNFYPIPMLSVEPEGSQRALFEALEEELKRRRQLRILQNQDIDSLEIHGVLSSVTQRTAIDDSIDMDPGGEPEEIEGELYVMPEDLAELLKDIPDRKAEMIINQFSDEKGVPDVNKIREHLLKERKRKKTAPKKGDELDF